MKEYDERCLISTYMIRCEYAETHGKNEAEKELLIKTSRLRAEDFTKKERGLSLDDFSRRRGWIR